MDFKTIADEFDWLPTDQVAKIYQAGALAMRERAAKVCADNQVAVPLSTKERFLTPWIPETESLHDGMTYAKFIRALPVEE